MNRRTVGTYLLGGWVLLTPPLRLTSEPPKGAAPEYVNTDAPLSRWEHESSYDTAAGCERAKTAGRATADSELSAHFDKVLKQHGGDLPAATKSSDVRLAIYRATVQGWYSARCVPAEHLYPPATQKTASPN